MIIVYQNKFEIYIIFLMIIISSKVKGKYEWVDGSKRGFLKCYSE